MGGVTFGSVASGPLVGVFATGVSPALTSASSDLFSLPTPIVLLEPLPPQPAIRPAAASAASAGGGARAGALKTWGEVAEVVHGRAA